MIISKLALSLLSPLGTALILWLLALILAVVGAKRLFFAAGLLGLGWLWLWSMPAMSIAVRGALEKEYPPIEFLALPRCEAAVLLGGAMGPPDSRHAEPDLNSAADGVRAAAQAYHAGKAPLLLLSGAGDSETWGRPEAEAMQTVLREFGVPDDVMILEGRSRDTCENARYSAVLLRARGIDRVLLITSALHMRRAVRFFALEGIEAVPVPADHEARTVQGMRRWIPDADALEGSARAIKEWVWQFMASFG